MPDDELCLIPFFRPLKPDRPARLAGQPMDQPAGLLARYPRLLLKTRPGSRVPEETEPEPPGRPVAAPAAQVEALCGTLPFGGLLPAVPKWVVDLEGVKVLGRVRKPVAPL